MAKKKILIRGGTVVSESGTAPYDIAIEDESIIAHGFDGQFDLESFDEIIDADGLLVLPGLIDPHVHFDAPFMGTRTDHDFLTGTKAAAFGGVTTVISFSTQSKGGSIQENLEKLEKKAAGQAYIDWSIHGILLDASTQSLSEIPELVKRGVPTYKCFTTYRHSDRMVDDDGILKVLKETAEHGGMLMVHCENDSIIDYRLTSEVEKGNTSWIYHALTRPRSAENVSIQRIIDLMKVERAPVYIVHTSTSESARIVQKAQLKGEPIHSETCTHYLVLTEDELKKENGYLFICSPPLRTTRDIDALWTAARVGPIEVISTDDAGLPRTDQTKLSEGGFNKVPSGMPGVEPRLTILYSEGIKKGRITWPRLVSLTAGNPSRLFGLAPQKGSLTPGSDADIVLFDANIKWTMSAESLHMDTDFCPFEGREVYGKPKTVLSRGEFVLRDYELMGTPRHGKRIFRKLDISNL
ncbi:Dihydropyrimidinase (EC [Olavius algarvensis Delta 1 endosymbiont]|nr:Dihydropyrimidinase (EC [Olavius algarvensis Delta 1 endosymbiont]